MTTPVPGWYTDPSGAPGERWWNGASWTEDTRPVAPPLPVPAAPTPADAPHGWDGFGQPAGPPAATPTPTYGTPAPPPMFATSPPPDAGSGSFVSRNGYSLATLGVVVGYLLILEFAGIAILGILPLFLGIRAVTRKEMLAWPAVVISVAAIVFGLYERLH